MLLHEFGEDLVLAKEFGFEGGAMSNFRGSPEVDTELRATAHYPK